jgi:surface protein
VVYLFYDIHDFRFIQQGETNQMKRRLAAAVLALIIVFTSINTTDITAHADTIDNNSAAELTSSAATSSDEPSDEPSTEPSTTEASTTEATAEDAKEEYTITFDANGGVFVDGENIETIVVTAGKAITELPDEPTMEGCDFTGWYTEPTKDVISGDGESADSESAPQQESGSQAVIDESYVPTEDATLYAGWKETEGELKTLDMTGSGMLFGSDVSWAYADGILTIGAGSFTTPYSFVWPWNHYTGYIKSVKFNGNVVATGSLEGMFSSCSSLTSIDLSSLDTSNATDMSSMFNGCKALTSFDLSDINTSNVTDMSNIFNGCSGLKNIDLSDINTSNVKNMSYMFSGCNSLTDIDLSSLNTSSVTDMNNIFGDCNGLTSLDLSKIDTSSVVDMSAMFYRCRGLTSLDLSGIDTSNVTNMRYMFENCDSLTSLDLTGFDTSSATNMSAMFANCDSLTSLDLRSFDTSHVTNMLWMFCYCHALTSIDISSFDTSNVTNMGSMFIQCTSLTSIDVSGFDTSNVTNMDEMFTQCYSLTNLSLSNFNTSKVTKFGSMFSSCGKLTDLDLSSFDTTNVTDMGSMFSGCSKLANIDLSSFDTSKVTDMHDMFLECSSLTSLDVGSFTMPSVNKMGYMFHDCTKLEKVYLPHLVEIPSGWFNLDNSITDVYYAGTEMEWNNITIGSSNGSLLTAKIHFGVSSKPIASGKCGENLKWQIAQKDSVITLSVTGTGDMCDYELNGDDNDVLLSTTAPWYEYASEINSVSISDGVTHIGMAAFAGLVNWKTYNMYLPSSCTSIGAYAFYQCEGLTGNVYIPSSVSSVDAGAFGRCSGLSIACWYADCSINDCEFYKCSGLQKIIIGDAVTTVGADAFSECDSLKKVYYNGSDSAWNKVSISTGNESLTNAELYTYYSYENELVDRVKLYTGDTYQSEFTDYIRKLSYQNLSSEELAVKADEFARNRGFADSAEGVKYCTQVNEAEQAYTFLTSSDCFLAANYAKDLTETEGGKIAAANMEVEGNIINHDVTQLFDPTIYATGETRTVKLYEKMLLELMGYKTESDQTAKYMKVAKTLLKDAYLTTDGTILDCYKNATTVEEVNKYLDKLEFGKYFPMHLKDFDEVNALFDNVGGTLDFVTDTTDVIKSLVNLETQLELIRDSEDFLTTVYKNKTLPDDMRSAAYILVGELDEENPWLHSVTSVGGGVLGDAIKDMVVEKAGKSVLVDVTGKTAAEAFCNSYSLYKIGVWCTDKLTGIGAYIEKAKYTVAYGLLGKIYSEKLEGDKDSYNVDPTYDNAKQFYDDYNWLLSIRKDGESAYSAMMNVPGFFHLLIWKGYSWGNVEKSDAYIAEKQKYMDEHCKFNLPTASELPQYHLYGQKVYIGCPVDVQILNASGNVICTIRDGVESDVTNEYGRFVCKYFPETDEYRKVVYLNNAADYSVRAVGTDSGSVSIQNVTSDNTMIRSGIPINEDEVLLLSTGSNEFSVSTGKDTKMNGILASGDDTKGVTGITPDSTQVGLKVGETVSVGVTLTPSSTMNDNYVWSTGDDQVATVLNGAITAIGFGTTTVKVSCGGVSADIAVSVTEHGGIEADDYAYEIKTNGKIPDGMWTVIRTEDGSAVADDTSFTYTGKSIKPQVHVYNGNARMAEKTDYTVSYKNNVNAAVSDAVSSKGKSIAPAIVLTLKGNYKDKKELTFTIGQADISEASAGDIEIVAPSNAKAVKVSPKLIMSGRTLKNKTDYTYTPTDISYDDWKALGSGAKVITVTGQGNYKGTKTIPLTVKLKNATIAISRLKFAKIADQSCTGLAVTPDITVTYGTDTYTVNTAGNTDDGVPFTVAYSKNINPGIASAVITAKPSSDFTGSKNVSFKIVAKKLSKAVFTTANKGKLPDKTYTGSEITFADGTDYSFSLDGKTLIKGTDYTYAYSKNINKGTATITFTGIGDYTGSSVKKTFKILAVDVSNTSAVKVADIKDVAFLKGGAKPFVKVTYASPSGRDITLKEGTDYKVTYYNNKTVMGSAEKKAPYVKITGAGNYTRFVTKTFAIIAQANEKGAVTIVTGDVAYSAKAGKWIGKSKVVDADGKILTSGKDYDKNFVYTDPDGKILTKADAVAAKTTITVTTTGLGNYVGSTITGTYHVMEYNISGVKVAFKDIDAAHPYDPKKGYEYTGGQIKPGTDDITVSYKGTELTAGTDYEIVKNSYTKNINKGTASFTIRGLGSYGGTKNVTFKIYQRSVTSWWMRLFG